MVDPLLDSIGRFEHDEPRLGGHYFHATQPEQFWAEHAKKTDAWLPHHPRAPWWVREVLYELSEHHCQGQIDAYQSLFLFELLTLLRRGETTDELADQVRAFAASASPVVAEPAALNAWLTSSEARGEYFIEAMREQMHAGRVPLPDYKEALAAAQALERRQLAEIVLSALTSDRGVLNRCLPAEFEGMSDRLDRAKAPLLRASSLLRGRSHAEMGELVRLFRAHGLLGISPLELEAEWDISDEERLITEGQQILARAALTIGLFG